MVEYILMLPILASFLVALFFLPSWIKRAKNAGLVGRDMNKFKEFKVAEAGGITVIAGFILGVLVYVALKTFFFQDAVKVIEIFALTSVILIVALIGMVDTLSGWKIGLSKRIRLFLVLFAAVPLMAINAGRSVISIPLIGNMDLGLIYPLLLIPIAIVGTTTTFNFLAGYNGLEARQGILILGALAIATWFTGNTWLTMVILCMIASLFAFLLFNTYPARVFPGDVMTYSIGALIGIAAILGNIEKFALFIFIPNIIEVFLKARGKLRKESFGLPQKDGSLENRYDKIYGLEHLALKIIKKFKGKAYENDVVNLINLFQITIIILAFIIFRQGIFG